jgi:hypothetical protein
VPLPHGIGAPIARHPGRAIGVAAGLGAVTGLLLQRRQRTHPPAARAVRGGRAVHVAATAPQPQRRRKHPAFAPPPGAGVARALASALVAVVTRALAARLRRGARRGWKTGKETRGVTPARAGSRARLSSRGGQPSEKPADRGMLPTR